MFQSRHSLQELSVIEVHVVREVRADRRLHVAQRAVQRGAPDAEEHRGYAQQGQENAGAPSDLICERENRGRLNHTRGRPGTHRPRTGEGGCASHQWPPGDQWHGQKASAPDDSRRTCLAVTTKTHSWSLWSLHLNPAHLYNGCGHFHRRRRQATLLW